MYNLQICPHILVSPKYSIAEPTQILSSLQSLNLWAYFNIKPIDPTIFLYNFINVPNVNQIYFMYNYNHA